MPMAGKLDDKETVLQLLGAARSFWGVQASSATCDSCSW